jgi:hypothetical protein
MNPVYHDTVFETIPTGDTPDFWVITAYNPDGKNAATGDNRTDDSRLRSEIVEMGFTPEMFGMTFAENAGES